MRRIVIVGGHPPPYGGNSTHAQRLARRLTKDGQAVAVIDPERRRVFLYQPRSASTTLALSDTPTVKSGLLPVLVYLAWHSIGRIVHYHMSMGRRFFRLSRFFNLLCPLARKRVITIHSGGFVQEMEALSERDRQQGLRVIGSFDDVICVSEAQRQYLQGRISSRIHTIPAFLPPTKLSEALAPAEVREWRKTVDVLLVTSGTGDPVYDFLTMIHGVELAQERLKVRLGLLISTYRRWDAEYWAGIEKALAASSLHTLQTRDLEPDVFTMVLALADLYLRASLTDGDSIAIREAAAMGVRVLASDAVQRPPGCVLFRTGDGKDLAERIVAAVKDTTLGKLPPEAVADNYPAVLSVYGLGEA